MCGTQALQFVSYRHGDTSLVRDARDQDFLLDVKKEYGPSLLDLGNIHKFERIFGRTVQVDRGLQSDSGVENLLGTLISSSEPAGPPGPVPGQPPADRRQPVHLRHRDPAADRRQRPLVPARHRQPAEAEHRRRRPGGQRATVGAKPAAGGDHERRTGAGADRAPALPFPLEYPRVQDAGGSRRPGQPPRTT